MKTRYFADYEDLCEYAFTISEDLYAEGESIAIVACDYFEAKEIFKILSSYDLDYFVLDLADYKDYTDEYVISIYDGQLSIEKAKYDDEYLYGEDKIVLMSALANSKITKSYKDSEVIIFDFEEDVDFEDGCDECEECDRCRYCSNYDYDGCAYDRYDDEYLYDLDLVNLIRFFRR